MNYLNKLSNAIHENAVKHGWWDDKPSNEHCLMLVVTEIAEMVEADRNKSWARMNVSKIKGSLASNDDIKECLAMDTANGYEERFKAIIKDTVEDEMADVAIRLLDLAGSLGMDFEHLNECRYHRAFDRFTFTENAFALCKGLSRENISIFKRIQFGLHFIEKWAKDQQVMLHFHVKAKHQFNLARPYKHGKSY